MTSLLAEPIFSAHADPTGAQKSPLALAMPDGSFALFWQRGTTLMLRLFGPDGQPRSGDLTLATGVFTYTATLGADGIPRLAMTGGAVNAWHINRATLSAQGLLGPITSVVTGLPGQPETPELIASGTGFQIAWNSPIGNSQPIHTLTLGPDGTPFAPPIILQHSPTDWTSPPRLLATDTGFLAVWEAAALNSRDAFAQLFDATGTPLAPAFLLHLPDSDPPLTPNMAQLENGDLLAVWREYIDNGYILWARRFDATGQPLGNAFAASPNPVSVEPPEILVFSDGGYAIVWEMASGDYGDLVIQRFDANDQPMGEPAFLHPPDAVQQRQLSLTVLADGRLLVTWAQGSFSDADVYARILDLRVHNVTTDETLSGQQHQTQLIAQGASLTIAEGAVLSTLNQNAVQSTGTTGAEVSVAGDIRAEADFGQFTAIRLMGTDGENSITIATTGTVQASLGPAIRLAGDANAVTNAGLIQGHGTALIGGEGRDTILNSGTMRGDVLLAAGNDIFDSRFGIVQGQIAGGLGDDLYLVGTAALLLLESAGEGQDRVQSLRSLTLADQIERLDLLGSANLSATGNAQANLIKGNIGNNRLTGLGGADSLQGGAGNDRLTGGQGIDQLSGGQGADRFVFATKADSNLRQPDTITDFRPGQDKIDLSALIGPKLTFFGTEAFDGEHAGLRLIKSQNWRVEVDLNADGRADMAFQINLTKTLTASEFIL
jgi:hypothetical protein